MAIESVEFHVEWYPTIWKEELKVFLFSKLKCIRISAWNSVPTKHNVPNPNIPCPCHSCICQQCKTPHSTKLLTLSFSKLLPELLKILIPGELSFIIIGSDIAPILYHEKTLRPFHNVLDVKDPRICLISIGHRLFTRGRRGSFDPMAWRRKSPSSVRQSRIFLKKPRWYFIGMWTKTSITRTRSNFSPLSTSSRRSEQWIMSTGSPWRNFWAYLTPSIEPFCSYNVGHVLLCQIFQYRPIPAPNVQDSSPAWVWVFWQSTPFCFSAQNRACRLACARDRTSSPSRDKAWLQIFRWLSVKT